MLDVLTMPTVQAVLGVTVLCVLIAGGFWFVSIYRDRAINDRLEADDLLSNFEEMHREGDISETEFRTIRASLGRQRHQASDDADSAPTSSAPSGPD
jgi:uncharacterized membrane protein